MDGSRFDRMARVLADRRSRRAALAGMTAAVMTPAILTQGQGDDAYVTCRWRLDAEMATGADAGQVISGLLSATIDREGWIDEATLEVDVQPGEAPQILAGVGMSNGRSIDLRFDEADGCGALALIGVGDDEIRGCGAFLDGMVRGGRLADLGGWRAAPEGICADGEIWDAGSCACGVACEEQACPDGEVWRESVCACACAPDECGDGTGWSWSACACVPKDGDEDEDEGSTPRVTATTSVVFIGDDTDQLCPVNSPCPAPKVLYPQECVCICPEVGCPVGMVVDPDSCACVLPVICIPRTCRDGWVWHQPLCSCSQLRCKVGEIGCGAACVDPKTSKSNCGTCGNVCAGACVAGACVQA